MITDIWLNQVKIFNEYNTQKHSERDLAYFLWNLFWISALAVVYYEK